MKYLRILSFILLCGGLTPVMAQTSGDEVANKLAASGFTNVRFADTGSSLLFTIENDKHKVQADGVKEALELIQSSGLDEQKTWKVFVTNRNVPEISITKETGYQWTALYDLGDDWDIVKKEKKKNSSLFNVDLVVYPQLALENIILNQVYWWKFNLSPALEVSLWPGMKLSAMLKLPVYNDGYGPLEDKVHPGNLTLSQRFRTLDKLQGKLTLGYFSNDTYGADLHLKYPLPDPRFTLDGRLGYVGDGYWDGMKLYYNTHMRFLYAAGVNFYWPQFKTQISAKAQRWVRGDHGFKMEMIRYFRHAAIGIYAETASGLGAKPNGGFRFQVTLPPYKYKRYKKFPRITTSDQMGLIYNGSNEMFYYKEYKAEASDNILEENELNPFYIQSVLNK